MLSNAALGMMLGVSEATVRRNLSSVGYRRYLIDPKVSGEFDLLKPIRVKPPIAITADWHIPLTDYAYANEMILECRTRGIKTLGIAGDMWNFDALGRFDEKQDDAGLSKELSVAHETMRSLLRTFDSIVFSRGNHDERYTRALGYKLRFEESMRTVFGRLGDEALERIAFSGLDHFWVDAQDGSTYVCHPEAYSRVPLSTARQLSAKLGCNVITAHSHHCAIGYATDGKHVVAEAGGFFDPSKVAYIQRSTTHPRWAQGYCIINESGKIEIRSPGFST